MKEFRSYEDLLLYVDLYIIPSLDVLDADEIVINPYSRKEFKLNPVQVALYDYIRGIEIVLSHPVYRIGLSNTDIYKMLQNADLCRDYFMYKWFNVYLGLID
jgi:hypothetical protein